MVGSKSASTGILIPLQYIYASLMNTENIPFLINAISPQALQQLRACIKSDTVHKEQSRNPSHICIFRLSSIDPGDYVRAIQEPFMLQVHVMHSEKSKKKKSACPSFQDVWDTSPLFRSCILQSRDPQEAKWGLQRRFGYKLATNFMPMYAKEIYNHFQAKHVLDPCAG